MVRKTPTIQQRFSRARGLEASLHSLNMGPWPPGTDVDQYRSDLLNESGGAADDRFMRGVVRALFVINPNIRNRSIKDNDAAYAQSTRRIEFAGLGIIGREQTRTAHISEHTRNDPRVQTLGELWRVQGFSGSTQDRDYTSARVPGDISVNGIQRTVHGTVTELGFSYSIAARDDMVRTRVSSSQDPERMISPGRLPADRLLEMADVVVTQLDGANPVLRR